MVKRGARAAHASAARAVARGRVCLRTGGAGLGPPHHLKLDRKTKGGRCSAGWLPNQPLILRRCWLWAEVAACGSLLGPFCAGCTCLSFRRAGSAWPPAPSPAASFSFAEYSRQFADFGVPNTSWAPLSSSRGPYLCRQEAIQRCLPPTPPAPPRHVRYWGCRHTAAAGVPAPAARSIPVRDSHASLRLLCGPSARTHALTCRGRKGLCSLPRAPPPSCWGARRCG